MLLNIDSSILVGLDGAHFSPKHLGNYSPPLQDTQLECKMGTDPFLHLFSQQQSKQGHWSKHWVCETALCLGNSSKILSDIRLLYIYIIIGRDCAYDFVRIVSGVFFSFFSAFSLCKRSQ